MAILKNKKCPRCETVKENIDFYRRRKDRDLSVYCKPCTSQQTIERQQKFKKSCVDYRGGKCEVCGYSRYIGALEFHHIDPTQKDFSIGKLKLTTFNDNIRIIFEFYT